MKAEIKETIKAEIAEVKANLDGQQAKLSQLVEIIEKGEADPADGPTVGQANLPTPGFDIKINGEPRKDISRDELKATLESMLELTHVKHPELEITITKVDSETNEPVTLNNAQIGKGIRYDDSVSIMDGTKRLIGDFKIEFTENGIKDISATYYKAYWNNQ